MIFSIRMYVLKKSPFNQLLYNKTNPIYIGVYFCGEDEKWIRPRLGMIPSNHSGLATTSFVLSADKTSVRRSNPHAKKDFCLLTLRKVEDSNLRCLSAYRISSAAHSTTLPTFQSTQNQCK